MLYKVNIVVVAVKQILAVIPTLINIGSKGRDKMVHSLFSWYLNLFHC